MIVSMQTGMLVKMISLSHCSWAFSVANGTQRHCVLPSALLLKLSPMKHQNAFTHYHEDIYVYKYTAFDKDIDVNI